MAKRIMSNGGSAGISGSNFDAFVCSQRNHRQENDWAAKLQEKYWRTRQKFLAKIERREDSCIVLSDSKLDAKLGIYRSIGKSCAHLIDILESYQNSLFVLANEENALGVLLRECGKHDRTQAGKIMTITGKSLTQSSHQRIKLYMPLMRLYQEMETFHSRAVDDSAITVDEMESKRSQYRASLMWMKDISEKLDPDIYKQLEKFRRIQGKVREDKKVFDGMQMDVVQKIDLLMASRCNLMNQILGPYQSTLLETFEKNYKNYKSVEEMIRKEDIYEYEFKTLRQLNPLRLDREKSEDTSVASRDQEEIDKPSEVSDLLQMDDDQKQNYDVDNNNNSESVSNVKLIEDEFGRPSQCDTVDRASDKLIDLTLDNIAPKSTRHATDLESLIEEPKDTLELLENLFGRGEAAQSKEKSIEHNLLSIDDLLSNDLELIDNSSHFKSLQGLQL